MSIWTFGTKGAYFRELWIEYNNALYGIQNSEPVMVESDNFLKLWYLVAVNMDANSLNYNINYN